MHVSENEFTENDTHHGKLSILFMQLRYMDLIWFDHRNIWPVRRHVIIWIDPDL